MLKKEEQETELTEENNRKSFRFCLIYKTLLLALFITISRPKLINILHNKNYQNKNNNNFVDLT